MEISKLKNSLSELFEVIKYARKVLFQSNSEGRDDLIGRMTEYQKICEHQIALANELEEHSLTQNWDEAERRIKIIDGLAQMVKADALTILRGKENQSAVN